MFSQGISSIFIISHLLSNSGILIRSSLRRKYKLYLYGLNFKYCSPKGLSKIGSRVGRHLMVDQNTKRKVGLRFASLLVKVGMDIKDRKSVV